MKNLNPGKKVYVNGSVKTSSEAIQVGFRGNPEEANRVRDFLLRILEEEKVYLADGSETQMKSNIFSGDVNLKIEIKKGKRDRMTAIINLSLAKDEK